MDHGHRFYHYHSHARPTHGYMITGELAAHRAHLPAMWASQYSSSINQLALQAQSRVAAIIPSESVPLHLAKWISIVVWDNQHVAGKIVLPRISVKVIAREVGTQPDQLTLLTPHYFPSPCNEDHVENNRLFVDSPDFVETRQFDEVIKAFNSHLCSLHRGVAVACFIVIISRDCDLCVHTCRCRIPVKIFLMSLDRYDTNVLIWRPWGLIYATV